jgi:hypothetical protein
MGTRPGTSYAEELVRATRAAWLLQLQYLDKQAALELTSPNLYLVSDCAAGYGSFAGDGRLRASAW